MDESEPLPDLIKNAYILLGKDWLETKRTWEKAGSPTPPVMITVANNTTTSARLMYSFKHDSFLLKIAGLEDLCNPDKILQIDSKVLEEVSRFEFSVSSEEENSKLETKNSQPKVKKVNGNKGVKSFVKNDHLGFVIHYMYQGVVRKYIPDFLVRFRNGTMLVLETKGRDREQDVTKRSFLDDWCRAVNQDGRFGRWHWRVSFDPNDLDTVLNETARSKTAEPPGISLGRIPGSL